MASTTFIDNQTVIYAAWLNDVNNAVYNGTFPNGSLSLTTLSVSGSVTGAGFTGLVNATLLTPGPIGSTTPNTGAFTTLNSTSLTVTNPIGSSYGGTGLSSPGSLNNLLVSNGTNWTSSPITGFFTNSLNSDGYQRLPGGLIIQWGVKASIPANSTATVTLPIAFTSSMFMAVGTAFGTNTSTSEFAQQCNSLSTTSFGISNPNGAQRSVYWIAIGF
jgi:hypothetical protein